MIRIKSINIFQLWFFFMEQSSRVVVGQAATLLSFIWKNS